MSRIFTAREVNQGSPWWWELRRGIVTASNFDKVLTPVTMKPSASQKALIAELCADVADQRPNWFSEKANKPPNHAIEEGIRREQESRDWIAYARGVEVVQVGFVLHDNGLWGCSPDGLLLADSGCLDGTLECKNPQADTQAGYLLDGRLPADYRCQCHGHLIVTDLGRCTFLSYHHDFERKLVVDVTRDEFTDKLALELALFTSRYLDALDNLGLRRRFEEQRQSCLAHFPQEAA
jgi:hypothetical protein